VCRFRVAAGKAKYWTRRLINCLELSQASKHYLQSFGFFPFGSINLGFLLRENLAVIFIIPSSWGSQLDDTFHNQHRAASSSFLAHIFYFVYCFALLYYYLHRFIKNTKKLVSLIVVFICLLLVLLE
jgi:hypothetical protein